MNASFVHHLISYKLVDTMAFVFLKIGVFMEIKVDGDFVLLEFGFVQVTISKVKCILSRQSVGIDLTAIVGQNDCKAVQVIGQ